MQTKHKLDTSKPSCFKAVVERFAVSFKVWQIVYFLRLRMWARGTSHWVLFHMLGWVSLLFHTYWEVSESI